MYRKKYAKLKVKFELGMRQSDALIHETLRIEDLSKRIQEQNEYAFSLLTHHLVVLTDPATLTLSQLLEVLLEFNDSLHVSPNLRFDLSMPDDSPFLPSPETEIAPLVNDATLARTALKEAKTELAAGTITSGAYRQVEESIKRNKAFGPAMQYRSLSQFPHTAPPATDQAKSADSNIERKLGYLTPEHETEFYLGLDAKLGDEAAAQQLERMPDPPTFAAREREANIRNPASVYNWLRRNQPQTLQDNEAASEKSATRPSNQRAAKRAQAQARKEEDMNDEDGVDVNPTPKGKRKRDEDTGYRPKGGSSRPKKKKDEPTSHSKAKKP